MLTVEIINNLLGITDRYQAPQAMLDIMLDNNRRNDLFEQFLKHETNVSYDWFLNYFETEHADRAKLKQDFTPVQIAELLAELAPSANNYHETAAGTGGIMIQHWNKQRLNTCWYQLEELSDRAIPFLIFNMAIRGISGVILHGDALEQTAKEVYLLRNNSPDFTAFSEVFKMEHTQELERELNIKFKTKEVT